MTTEDHKNCAKAIRKIKRILRDVKYKGKADVSSWFTVLQSILDDDYHKGISEETFKKLGHIYYRGNKGSE